MKTAIRVLAVTGLSLLELACDRHDSRATAFVAGDFGHEKKTANINAGMDEAIAVLPYEESVNKFGYPIATEDFENAKEGQVFPGIRAGIGKYFPAGKEVTIREAIWLCGSDTKIAVWYVRERNRWVPFSHFKYDKDANF